MTDKAVSPAGNLYDKFNTKNPIARILINRYKKSIEELCTLDQFNNILEVGCGEGFLTELIEKAIPSPISAIDICPEIIFKARNRSPTTHFTVADARYLPYPNNCFDLVLACEVLEHVLLYDDVLREITRVSKRFCLFSVPREPLWRFLNLLRLSYIRKLGNTPGHVRHWSSNEFIRLLTRNFRVLEVRLPLPWTIALCEIREPHSQ